MNTSLNGLIIEDSEDDALLLASELKAAGFDMKWKRVETEPDYCASLGPHLDLIFSDFTLPRFSTPRALALLQNSGHRIPFIIVSGTIGEERAVECLRNGATDYVLKNRLARIGPVVTRALNETRTSLEHERAEEELRWRTAFFEALVESSLDGILVLNSRGRMIVQNPQLRRMFKIPDDVISDMGDSKMLQHLASQMKDPRRFTERVNYILSHPDDIGQSEIEMESGTVLERHHSPVRDKAGRHFGRIWTFRDITERRKLEEQYRHSQKMEAVGQLAGGVAHDFNNNLAVIQGYATLLLADTNTPKEIRESLEQISRAAENAANLTRQLLAFSRKQVMQFQVLDLNLVVGNLSKILQRILGEDIALKVNYHSNLPPILADAGMLEQVLMNLAVNARDAMPEGGRLTISTLEESINEESQPLSPEAAPGDYVCLVVTDTGTGIAPEILPHIFEPFFTTKALGKGTGLGLPTVYGIVRQHHGWIHLHSELGKGTTFRIHLPTRKGELAAQNTHSGNPEIPGGTETLLLVEDEPALRTLTKRLLERQGYTVLDAASGADALKIWRDERDRISLVLTDMVMPDSLSGPELAKRLKQDKSGLRVIFTSGYGASFTEKEVELTEGVNYLQKPCSFPYLAQTLRNALDN
jgi:PAS domain S-box-containing protein